MGTAFTSLNFGDIPSHIYLMPYPTKAILLIFTKLSNI